MNLRLNLYAKNDINMSATTLTACVKKFKYLKFGSICNRSNTDRGKAVTKKTTTPRRSQCVMKYIIHGFSALCF